MDTPTSPKRFVLVGVGRFGANHLKALRDLGVPLTIVDKDEKALAKAAQEVPGAKTARSLVEVLPEASAVSIVTTAPAHGPLAIQAMEAGLDVFIEKPLAPTAKESSALAAKADALGRILQVGHIYRYHPASAKAREMIRTGAIGTPRYAHAIFSGFKRPRTDGGAATSDGVHFVDLCAFLLDAPARTAMGATRDFLGLGQEDVSFLSFDHGAAMSHVEASYFLPGRARKILVVGSDAMISIDFDAKPALSLLRHAHRKDPLGAWTAIEGAVEHPEVPAADPLRTEIQAFLDSVKTRTRPLADGWVGTAAVAAIETALASAKEGRALPIPDFTPKTARRSL
ncbi:MAG: Gfo/Idh/MocA family oxidoreductase [Planctomycetota bacterium]